MARPRSAVHSQMFAVASMLRWGSALISCDFVVGWCVRACVASGFDFWRAFFWVDFLANVAGASVLAALPDAADNGSPRRAAVDELGFHLLFSSFFVCLELRSRTTKCVRVCVPLFHAAIPRVVSGVWGFLGWPSCYSARLLRSRVPPPPCASQLQACSASAGGLCCSSRICATSPLRRTSSRRILPPLFGIGICLRLELLSMAAFSGDAVWFRWKTRRHCSGCFFLCRGLLRLRSISVLLGSFCSRVDRGDEISAQQLIWEPREHRGDEN